VARAAVQAYLLLALAGCSPVVDAKFSDVVVTRPDISIPAAPTAGLTSVTFSFSMDSSKLGASSNPAAQNQIASAKLHEISLTAKGGITDLSFIKTLHTIAYVPLRGSGATSENQVEIADYERSGTQPVGAVLTVPPPEPVDLLPLLRPTSTEQTKIVVVVNLGGELPMSAWKADVSMSLSIELHQ
jgi:hypothetical protein